MLLHRLRRRAVGRASRSTRRTRTATRGRALVDVPDRSACSPMLAAIGGWLQFAAVLDADHRLARAGRGAARRGERRRRRRSPASAAVARRSRRDRASPGGSTPRAGRDAPQPARGAARGEVLLRRALRRALLLADGRLSRKVLCWTSRGRVVNGSIAELTDATRSAPARSARASRPASSARMRCALAAGARRPRPRLHRGRDDAHGWLTNVLILLPLVRRAWSSGSSRCRSVWIAPAASARLAVRDRLLDQALVRFDFDAAAVCRVEPQHAWLKDDSASRYHVGCSTASRVWLVGLTVVVMRRVDRATRSWVGRDRPRAYYGLMLFLTGAIVGVFTSQDLLLFYVFWEAMLIPLYVLIGVWGGAGRLGRDDQVRHLHDGRVAADARGRDRLRRSRQGTFDLDRRRDERELDWIFLGFAVAFASSRRRCSRSTAGCRTPTASRQPEVSAVLSGVDLEGRGVTASCGSAFAQFPAGRARLPDADPRARRRSGSSTGRCWRFRAPDIRGVIAYSSLAQMGLIMLGLFATNRPRDQRRRAPDGQPRADLRGAVPARRAPSSGARRPDASTASAGWRAAGRRSRRVLMTIGVMALAVPGSSAFAGEFAILAGVFQQGWGCAVVGAVAIVLAAMYVLRLISAVLHRAAGPAVTDSALDLPARRARDPRAPDRAPAVPVRLAGGDHRPGDRMIAAVEPPARRLVRALAGAVAARRGGHLPRWSRCSCQRRASRATAALVGARRGFVTAFVSRCSLYDRSPDGESVDRRTRSAATASARWRR